MRIISTFQTENYHGYNIKYSISSPNLLACASSENYGIAGKIAKRCFNLQKNVNVNNECVRIFIFECVRCHKHISKTFLFPDSAIFYQI